MLHKGVNHTFAPNIAFMENLFHSKQDLLSSLHASAILFHVFQKLHGIYNFGGGIYNFGGAMKVLPFCNV